VWLPGELAGAAANLQHGGTRGDRGIRDDGVADLGGIPLAGDVIQPGHAVEKHPPLLPRPALLRSLGVHKHSLAQTSPVLRTGTTSATIGR
jgi:hypothetical protein